MIEHVYCPIISIYKNVHLKVTKVVLRTNINRYYITYADPGFEVGGGGGTFF